MDRVLGAVFLASCAEPPEAVWLEWEAPVAPRPGNPQGRFCHGSYGPEGSLPLALLGGEPRRCTRLRAAEGALAASRVEALARIGGPRGPTPGAWSPACPAQSPTPAFARGSVLHPRRAEKPSQGTAPRPVRRPPQQCQHAGQPTAAVLFPGCLGAETGSARAGAGPAAPGPTRRAPDPAARAEACCAGAAHRTQGRAATASTKSRIAQGGSPRPVVGRTRRRRAHRAADSQYMETRHDILTSTSWHQ